MKLIKKMGVSLVVSLLLFSTGFFWSYLPCQINPGIPGAESYWTYCNLGSDNLSSHPNASVLYLGWTESLFLINATFIMLAFLIFFILLNKLFKSKKG